MKGAEGVQGFDTSTFLTSWVFVVECWVKSWSSLDIGSSWKFFQTHHCAVIVPWLPSHDGSGTTSTISSLSSSCFTTGTAESPRSSGFLVVVHLQWVSSCGPLSLTLSGRESDASRCRIIIPIIPTFVFVALGVEYLFKNIGGRIFPSFPSFPLTKNNISGALRVLFLVSSQMQMLTPSLQGALQAGVWPGIGASKEK